MKVAFFISALVLAFFLSVSISALPVSVMKEEASAPDLRWFSGPQRPLQMGHPWVPWEPRPVLGPQKTLVLMVEFSDVKFKSSPHSVVRMVEAVKEWFEESSYGKMTVDYYLHPYPITLPRPYSYYGAPKAGAQRGDDPKRILEYYITTFNLVYKKTDIDLANYTHIILIHAGGDEAVTSNPNDIWSHCFCLGPVVKKLPTETLEELKGILYLPSKKGGWHAIYGIETISEEEDMLVMIHEFAHSNGVPDLYIYASDGYSKGSEAGFWSNMDAGAMIGADIDGWSKYILGWVEPKVYTIPVNDEVDLYTLDNLEGLKAILVKIPGDPDHYYFIHARRRAGHDVNLPGEGVLVFKVNRMLPKTIENNFMVKMFDANPNTPKKCIQYLNDFDLWSMCIKLDAPLNDNKTYRWGRWTLSFRNPVFWSEEDGFGLKVLSYDEERGIFRVKLASSLEALGGKAVTTITTTTSTKTETRTTITTISVTPRSVSGGASVWFFIVLLITMLIAAAFIVSVRRREKIPVSPPPPAAPMKIVYNYCPVCGARLYPGVRYCWRCGTPLNG